MSRDSSFGLGGQDWPGRTTVGATEREKSQVRSTWLQIVSYRYLATVVISVAIAAVPVFGPYRVWIAVGVAAVGLVATLVVRSRILADRPFPRSMVMVDMATALGVIALVPSIYAVAVTIIVSMLGLFVFWFGGRFTAALIPFVGAGLLALGLWQQPVLWVPAIIAWFITAVFSTAIFTQVARTSDSSRKRYDELVNGIDAVVWEANSAYGRADYVSESVADLLGFSPRQCRDLSFLTSRIHPDDIAEVSDTRRHIGQGENVESRFRILDGSGRWRYVQHRVRVTRGPDGKVLRRRGVLVDETDRWEAQASVRRYSDFIEGIPIALVILRLDDPETPGSFRIVAANPAAAALFHVDVEGILSRPVTDVVPIGGAMLDRLADVVRLGEPLERPFIQLPGVEEVFALRAVPLPDSSVGISLEDVTKRARLAESFRHQALHDPLTGLPNRALLHDRLTRAMAAAERTQEPVALLMMDLNQFKEVNDALGHEYGDRLLIELSRRLGRHLRDCDTIARLGGDEFAILLTTGASVQRATEVAERLADLCVEPFQIGEYRLQISASVGIAVAPDHAADAETLLRRADGAMYRAKGSGGGVAVYAPGEDQSNVRRLELLADLREAVTTDAFVVHYQPRVDLHTLRPVGVEALVRWHHPRHGLLAPGEFIELAEVSGAIQLLTQTVTSRATGEVRGLMAASGLSVSVNMSVRNLYDPTLVSWVGDLLATSALPAGSLCFELTESQLMDDPSHAMEVLQELRRIGVRFSVDDFGTGYSSLAYLRELPIDEVKIDRSFVADLEYGDSRIVRSVIDLGHNLGLHVVAEGVESPTVLQRLRELGCDSAQGYHLAMPMPFADLSEYLRTASAPEAAATR